MLHSFAPARRNPRPKGALECGGMTPPFQSIGLQQHQRETQILACPYFACHDASKRRHAAALQGGRRWVVRVRSVLEPAAKADGLAKTMQHWAGRPRSIASRVLVRNAG